LGLGKLRLLAILKDWHLKLTCMGKLHKLQAELEQGHSFVVSDGSFCEDKGTAAWIIEGKDKEHHIIGVWTTPRITQDHRSFHKELWGLYRILINLVHLHPTTSHPQFHLACDGLAAKGFLNPSN